MWELIGDLFLTTEKRAVRGERVEVSRKVLVLISIAIVLNKEQAEQVVVMANRLLDAGGYKVLTLLLTADRIVN